jgi:uncharacterized membrane protein
LDLYNRYHQQVLTRGRHKTHSVSTMNRRLSFTAVPGLVLVIAFILSIACNDSGSNYRVHAFQQPLTFGSGKHHVAATTNREQRLPYVTTLDDTTPVLFRTPSPLFQSKSSSNRSANHPLSVAAFESFDNTATSHPKSNTVLSKFFSLFRIQRLKWFLQQQQRNVLYFQRHFKTLLLPILFSLILCFSSLSSAWAAPGGRMGGSFGKSSSSSSYSRPSQSYSRPYYSDNSPRVTVIRPPSSYYYFGSHSPFYYGSRATSSVVEVSRGFSATDVAVLTGVGLVMANGIRNNYRNDHDDRDSKSALGGGVTVASLTVALNVPRRHDANNILTKLHRLSQSARTDTRKGLQDLVSTGKYNCRMRGKRACVCLEAVVYRELLLTLFFAVAMELLRQERSIISVRSSSQHVKRIPEAQRIFNQISTRERSKFDREAGMFYRLVVLLLCCVGLGWTKVGRVSSLTLFSYCLFDISRVLYIYMIRMMQ